ncbi:unnamed protein product [Mytilus edulis]|uniref:CCHC-type domain-containing protein n=1 Tax=Mytilus edulis TaxID=6550 RepID=A0A8S3SHQ2_MYTED|nr:unnamed protein product [Mytilus edulis]
MDDSLQSDIIQFNPTDRSSIASDDTVENITHAERTSSQSSYESTQTDNQSNSLPAISPAVGDIFESLTNQIRDTFHMVTQQNAANLSMMEDRFQNQITQLKEEIFNLREDFNKQKSKSDQIQSERSEIIVPEAEIIKTHAVPSISETCSYQNYNTSNSQNTRAIRYDTFNQADRIRYHTRRLTNAVAGMSIESKNKCFRCGEKGHVRKACPYRE